MSLDSDSQMWFGTLDRMRWIDTPNSGADMSPSGWSAEGTLLNGLAYSANSVGTHKIYTFEWKSSSAPSAAQTMKSYRDGTYGRGLLYFIDPLIMRLNILPARWANPGMACGYEGPPLVYGVYPTPVSVSGGEAFDLPVSSAYYNLAAIAAGYRSDRDTLFIPIPDGYTLYLGAIHSVTGSGKVYATPVNTSGTLGTAVVLTALGTTPTDLVPDTFSGVKGVRLWVGKSATGAATVTLTAITARLYRTGFTPPASFTAGPWVGGMGHSGCSFSSTPPTYVANTGIDGGQVGYAATFIETGDGIK